MPGIGTINHRKQSASVLFRQILRRYGLVNQKKDAWLKISVYPSAETIRVDYVLSVEYNDLCHLIAIYFV